MGLCDNSLFHNMDDADERLKCLLIEVSFRPQSSWTNSLSPWEDIPSKKKNKSPKHSSSDSIDCKRLGTTIGTKKKQIDSGGQLSKKKSRKGYFRYHPDIHYYIREYRKTAKSQRARLSSPHGQYTIKDVEKVYETQKLKKRPSTDMTVKLEEKNMKDDVKTTQNATSKTSTVAQKKSRHLVRILSESSERESKDCNKEPPVFRNSHRHVNLHQLGKGSYCPIIKIVLPDSRDAIGLRTECESPQKSLTKSPTFSTKPDTDIPSTSTTPDKPNCVKNVTTSGRLSKASVTNEIRKTSVVPIAVKEKTPKHQVSQNVLQYLGYGPSISKCFHEVYKHSDVTPSKSPTNSSSIGDISISSSKKVVKREPSSLTSLVARTLTFNSKMEECLTNAEERPILPRQTEPANTLIEPLLIVCRQERPKLAILPKLDTVVKPKFMSKVAAQ